MKQRKIPMRKCTGCNEMKPKNELIRVVKAPDKLSDTGEILEKGTPRCDGFFGDNAVVKEKVYTRDLFRRD